MSKRSLLSIAAAAALLVTLLPAAIAQAQEATEVLLVHGLNLDGQTTQAEGGSPVTVCNDEVELLADFQFGEIVGPVELPTGEALNVFVYEGADVDCATVEQSTAIIGDIVTPEGEAIALAALDIGDRVGLYAFEVPIDCVDEGEGRLQTLHASGDTPAIEVVVEGVVPDSIEFGQSLVVNLPVGDYPVEVRLAGTPIVGPVDVGVKAATNTMVFVTGNIDEDTPVVPLLHDLAITQCPPDAPPDTTTSVVTPTSTPTPVVQPVQPGATVRRTPAGLSLAG